MPIDNIFTAAGLVAWPLLAFSLAAIAAIFERSVFWWRVHRRQPKVMREVLRLLATKPDSALQRLRQNADLPLPRIFLDALSLKTPTPEEFRLALESSAQAELPTLKRFGTVFETIVSVAPLLGLLGTILGLIRSFSSLQLGQLGGAQTTEVTAGIGEALVSTALGLVVAIFTLLFANLFRSFYLRQMSSIREYGGQLELFYRRQYERQKEDVRASA